MQLAEEFEKLLLEQPAGLEMLVLCLDLQEWSCHVSVLVCECALSY